MVRTSGPSPVCLVHLVSFVQPKNQTDQPNQTDRPNRPNEQDGLVDFFSILYVQTTEHGMVRFESPEVGVRSPQREERGGRDYALKPSS